MSFYKLETNAPEHPKVAIGADMNLSLVGKRMAPRETGKEIAFVPKTGQKYPPDLGAKTMGNKRHFDQTVFQRKERTGYGGGFKIPEEYRKSMLSRKKQTKKDAGDSSEDEANRDQSLVTKEEVMAHLNLGTAENTLGGKYGANSKNALTKDLLEGLDKDLEKLRRLEENIKLRRIQMATGGTYVEETDEQKEQARIQAIQNDVLGDGGAIIHADEKRLQVFRHKPGMLDTLKDETGEREHEFERERLELKRQADDLERSYWSKKENSQVGKLVRKKLAMKNLVEGAQTGADDEEQANSKFVTIAEGDDAGSAMGDTLKPKKSSLKSSKRAAEPESDAAEELEETTGRMGTKTRKALDKMAASCKSGDSTLRKSGKPKVDYTKPIFHPPGPSSPRRQLYEAKYEKYLSNLSQKKHGEKRQKSLTPAPFDIVTKNASSPSKNTSRYKQNQLQTLADSNDLIPAGYEDHLIREDLKKAAQKDQDPFEALGVSNEDKMTFFLLKWVFNAIKQEGGDIPEGNNTASSSGYIVSKADLIKQLQKNQEIMSALDISSPRALEAEVKKFETQKPGILTWTEFLNFFFLKDKSLINQLTSTGWWLKLNDKGLKVDTKRTPTKDPSKDFDLEEGRGESSAAKLLREFTEVPMTPALEMLMKSRRVKTEQEVEDDFNKNQKLREQGLSPSGKPLGQKKKPQSSANVTAIDNEDAMAELGFGMREKSQNLLLPSHLETMKEVYEKLDKYSDQILKRSEFLMALRTDERVVDFIDANAVKVASAKAKTLTLDQILVEVERDETFEMMNSGKNEEAINHKEFITWREFLTYFEDYQEIEERNKKSSSIAETRAKLKEQEGGASGAQNADLNPDDEMKSLLEQEKQRRLQEIPRLRPADMIDISEDQLQIIKDIFDNHKIGNICQQVQFFLALRKSPELKKLSSAIARDPEGTSRIARETFQQVFDRMEHENSGKKDIEWAVIVEFFTKRGRPLTKEEIEQLKVEDLKMKEEAEEQRRRGEEHERRRQQRLMEDLEEDEDFEAFEARQTKDPSPNQNSGERETAEDEYGHENDSQERDSDDESGDFDRAEDLGIGSGLGRSQSAKQIRPDRVSAQDYHQKSQGGEVRRGKYGITVPRPFGFDVRDKVRAKTIRERKVEEMVTEKQVEEEMALKTTFRCKPIPSRVLQPHYEKMCQSNDDRRRKVKQHSLEITRQREQPFSFWEREKVKIKEKREANDDANSFNPHARNFQANPIPKACSVLIYHQKLESEEQSRKKRIHEQAEINYAKARMPSRMQKDQDRKSQLPPKDKHQEYSFQPKIGEMKTGEMFRAMQRKFEEQMMQKKSQVSTTKPKSPRFYKTKTKPLERNQYNEKPPKPQKFGMDTIVAKDQTQVKQPSSTKAMQLMQKKRREDIVADKAKIEKEAREDAKRKQREKDLAKTMVEPNIVTNYDNGKKGSQVAKLRMLHSYIETMEQSGLTQAQINATLKREELDLLEEEKFIAAKKGIYGGKMSKTEKNKMHKVVYNTMEERDQREYREEQERKKREWDQSRQQNNASNLYGAI